MADFHLHPQLAADTFYVRELSLSALLLMNDGRFPWLILVPRRSTIVELTDLSDGDRLQVWDEIDTVTRLLKAEFHADKMNVAALGNVVPQLHIHIIARMHNDAAWPRPVWGVGSAETYARDKADAMIAKLNRAIDLTGL
jgi:diadenosine tetraphosphate (Ap4A) HIT family hydrolase